MVTHPLMVFGVTTLTGGWTPAFASGFAITAQGAGGMARSSAFTAQADDPSAVYYNPAGITQLPSTRILVGTTALRPHAEYEPTGTGNAATERERYYVLPHLYVTTPLGGRITAGLGVFTPFGLSTKWPADWDGRFQVIDATIRATAVNPVLAWRPTEWFTVATGVQYFNVKLAERRALNLAPFAEGAVSLSGDARAFGYNAAVLVVPSARWQLGVSYRSRVNAEIKDGLADFTIPVGFPGSIPDSAIRTAVMFPPSLRTGLLVRPTPNLNVEVDATWTGWSTVDQLEIKFASGFPTEVTNFGWRDVMAYGLGLEYRVTPTVRLRGGYLYDLSPIPDAYVTPLIPDADRQGVSVGVGVTSDRWSLDAGYQFLMFERTKSNSVGSSSNSNVPLVDARANGQYRSNAHVLGVSAGHTF
jgi:long-chain fatty acid transport protein